MPEETNQNLINKMKASIDSNVSFLGKSNLVKDRIYPQNSAMGSILFPYKDESYDDDGTTFLGDMGTKELPVNIVGYDYMAGNEYGRGISKRIHPDWIMPLDEAGKFDFCASYWATYDYITNFTIHFYDIDDIHLGSLLSKKDMNTWSRSDYSTFSFYDSDNKLILEIGANNFSGDTYGNGEVSGSLDLSNSSMIKLMPKSYSPNPYCFYLDRVFDVAHPFDKAKSIRLSYVDQYAYYSNSSTQVKFGQFNKMWKIENRI